MWSSEHRLLSFDGTPLFFRILSPQTKNLAGRVLILHGMGEHGGRYLALAGHLAACGFESVVPDLRGFGKSGGPRAFANAYSVFHSDLSAILSFVEKSRTKAPLFYLGHSFGGLLVSSYLAVCQVPADGLILSSPLFGIASRVPAWRHVLGLLTAFCFPRYSQATSVIPEALTHDEALIELYKKDTLIYHRITAGLYVEMLKLMNERSRVARALTLPTLVLQAGDDRIVDKEKTLLFYEELAATDKKMQLFPGLYHELFNEKERESIFGAVSAWLQVRKVCN